MYRNSFVTDLPLGPDNVVELAACGRASLLLTLAFAKPPPIAPLGRLDPTPTSCDRNNEIKAHARQRNPKCNSQADSG